MITYLLMGLLVLGIAFSTLWGVKYEPNKTSFMSIEDTTALRGFWCIIVVLVHVPTAYQNRIQDMLGSFAYIGVTFFFMASAYGLKYGVAHKKNYLRGFWRKRLPAILVPALLCNIVSVLIKVLIGDNISILSFININDWVKVLLLFYFVFWLVYYIPERLEIIGGGYWKDILICLIIILFSLIDRLTPLKLTLIWPTESIGFAYGIFLANCAEMLKKWTNRKWTGKSIVFFLLGIILGVLYLKFKYVSFWGDYCLKILLGFVLLMLILQLVRRITIGNKLLSFLGDISYEVYLLHGAVFTLLAGVSGIKDSGVFIWSAVIITIIFAAIVNRVSKAIVTNMKKDRTKNIY